jgi:hypothetical protein
MERLRTDLGAAGAAACVAALLCAGNLSADPLGEARDVLCTVLDVHVCVETAGCDDVLAEELNVPRFIQVDTQGKKLSTTEASGEMRETVVESAQRDAGQITLQGVESGRAFSLFISESTGLATFASAAEGRSVSAFGICTPLPVK